MGWSGPLTHRQHVMLSAWVSAEWNRPGRLEHYLMMINTSVQRILSKNPMSVRIEHSKLEFKFDRSVKASKEERAARVKASQAAWRAAAGGASRLTVYDRDGNLIRAATQSPRSIQYYGRRRPARVQGQNRPRVVLWSPGRRPGTFDQPTERPITPPSPQRRVRDLDADPDGT